MGVSTSQSKPTHLYRNQFQFWTVQHKETRWKYSMNWAGRTGNRKRNKTGKSLDIIFYMASYETNDWSFHWEKSIHGPDNKLACFPLGSCSAVVLIWIPNYLQVAGSFGLNVWKFCNDLKECEHFRKWNTIIYNQLNRCSSLFLQISPSSPQR